jgi:hypothetical protein
MGFFSKLLHAFLISESVTNAAITHKVLRKSFNIDRSDSYYNQLNLESMEVFNEDSKIKHCIDYISNHIRNNLHNFSPDILFQSAILSKDYKTKQYILQRNGYTISYSDYCKDAHRWVDNKIITPLFKNTNRFNRDLKDIFVYGLYIKKKNIFGIPYMPVSSFKERLYDPNFRNDYLITRWMDHNKMLSCLITDVFFKNFHLDSINMDKVKGCDLFE